MSEKAIYDLWKEHQGEWDDEEFLESIPPLQKLRYRRLNEHVAAFLAALPSSRGPLLLDAGCGRADFRLHLPEGWRYLGLDPSLPQLRHRSGPQEGVFLLQGAAESLPLRDCCVRVVLIKEVLDHGWDPARIFQEARRVLEDGGYLVVTVTNDRSWFKRLLPGVNRALKARQRDHYHFFGPADLENLAREARFDSLRVETYNHLKLPGFLERTIGLAGEGFQRFTLDFTDAIGRLLFPRLGGGMMLTARKTPGDGSAASPPLENRLSQNSPVSPDLLNLLICPSCGAAIRPKGEDLECTACRRTFPVKEGIPSLLPEPTKGS